MNVQGKNIDELILMVSSLQKQVSDMGNKLDINDLYMKKTIEQNDANLKEQIAANDEFVKNSVRENDNLIKKEMNAFKVELAQMTDREMRMKDAIDDQAKAIEAQRDMLSDLPREPRAQTQAWAPR